MQLLDHLQRNRDLALILKMLNASLDTCFELKRNLHYEPYLQGTYAYSPERETLLNDLVEDVNQEMGEKKILLVTVPNKSLLLNLFLNSDYDEVVSTIIEELSPEEHSELAQETEMLVIG